MNNIDKILILKAEQIYIWNDVSGMYIRLDKNWVKDYINDIVFGAIKIENLTPLEKERYIVFLN